MALDGKNGRLFCVFFFLFFFFAKSRLWENIWVLTSAAGADWNWYTGSTLSGKIVNVHCHRVTNCFKLLEHVQIDFTAKSDQDIR